MDTLKLTELYNYAKKGKCGDATERDDRPCEMAFVEAFRICETVKHRKLSRHKRYILSDIRES